MAKVLLYNIHPTKAAKLKMLCRNFFIEAVEVAPADYGKKIADLLSGGGSGEAPEASFNEEMVYFADINGGFLNLVLDRMRRQKLGVALKAVKTDTNVQFTSFELFRELSAERDAIAKGTTAHEEANREKA